MITSPAASVVLLAGSTARMVALSQPEVTGVEVPSGAAAPDAASVPSFKDPALPERAELRYIGVYCTLGGGHADGCSHCSAPIAHRLIDGMASTPLSRPFSQWSNQASFTASCGPSPSASQWSSPVVWYV